MLKKSLLVSAIAATASSAAFADGFYWGLGLGVTDLHNQYTVSGQPGQAKYGSFGALANITGGYGFVFANKMTLGLEGFFNVTSAQTNDSLNNGGYGTVSLRGRYNYGLRVLPGYQVTPSTNLYGIVGYVRGNFKYTNSDTNGTTSSFNANGYQLGVGSSVNVAKNVAVRGDIIYSGYQSKSLYDSSWGTNVTNQPSTFDGIVSVIYKFG